MENLFVTLSIAAAITMGTMFRYRLERQRFLIIGYFAAIVLIEVLMSYFILPDMGIGFETGLVCWIIFVLFFVARKVVLRLEAA